MENSRLDIYCYTRIKYLEIMQKRTYSKILFGKGKNWNDELFFIPEVYVFIPDKGIIKIHKKNIRNPITVFHYYLTFQGDFQKKGSVVEEKFNSKAFEKYKEEYRIELNQEKDLTSFILGIEKKLYK